MAATARIVCTMRQEIPTVTAEHIVIIMEAIIIPLKGKAACLMKEDKLFWRERSGERAK